MKRLIWATLALLLAGSASFAQDAPKVEVSAGYSFLYIIKGFTIATNGGSGSVAFNATNWLGIVGDYGAYHGSPGGQSLNIQTYTFGPRFSYRKNDRFVPFAQALFGGSHASGDIGGFTSSANPFAFALGVGGDLALGKSGRFALRPQGEYVGFRAAAGTANTIRLSLGIVCRFGQK